LCISGREKHYKRKTPFDRASISGDGPLKKNFPRKYNLLEIEPKKPTPGLGSYNLKKKALKGEQRFLHPKIKKERIL